jgi:hypothetical protein
MFLLQIKGNILRLTSRKGKRDVFQKSSNIENLRINRIIRVKLSHTPASVVVINANDGTAIMTVGT